MDREGALHADAEGDLADRERLVQAPALATDHHPVEDLDPLPVPFDHPHVDLHGVAGTELGQVVAEERAIDEVGVVHARSPGAGGRAPA
jgi:hypothetical protein